MIAGRGIELDREGLGFGNESDHYDLGFLARVLPPRTSVRIRKSGCVILADGFYEWERDETGAEMPY